MDAFSSLSDEILVHIISFLSTEEAATKSILSTRWRHLWKLTGRLLLQTPDIWIGHRQEELVDSVLSSFQNPNFYPSRELSIMCEFGNSTTIDVIAERWVSFAIDLHNVEILSMWLRPSRLDSTEYMRFTLPSSCNRINNLMHLKISSRCKILPSFECFRNLKSISLETYCIVTDAAFESINLNCTSLERLRLSRVRLPELLRVSSSLCPLKHLAICYCYDIKTAFIESPSLEELELANWIPTSQGLHLFAPRLKELTLRCCEDMPATLALIEGSTIGRFEKLGLMVNRTLDLNFNSHHPRRLNHVTKLSFTLHIVMKDLRGLDTLLRVTSRLETLRLKFGCTGSNGESPNFDALISGGNLKLQSLKRIRIQAFDHRKYYHLMMLKYLVEVAVRMVEIEIAVQYVPSEDLCVSKKSIEDCIGDKLCCGSRMVILPNRYYQRP